MGESPICYIIGGPNGAGKTTFVRKFLPDYTESDLFINSDLIASGLSPFNPEHENFLAGRLMLEQIDKYASEKRTFMFETTFSGKGYVDRILNFKQSGYRIIMFYIMIADIETSLKRIEVRVSKGGHNIPEEDVRRRFSRSASNFLNVYSPLSDEWEIYDNSLLEIRAVANLASTGIQVFDQSLYLQLKQHAEG